MTNKNINLWRVRLIQLLFLLFLFIIFFRIIYLQVVLSKDLKKLADNQKRFSTSTPVFRGEIIDRKGMTLAVDSIKFDVYIHPKNYNPSIEKEEKLAEILNINAFDLQKIAKRKYISRLVSGLDKKSAKQINLLKIRGIEVHSRNYRIYPQNKLASHILGFVNWSFSGDSGIENAFDRYLQIAKDHRKQVILRSDGLPVYHLSPYVPVINSSLGQVIELTIDSGIQYKTENILKKNVEIAQPDKATVIIMDVKTGEILSWANYPDFNPNEYSKYPLENMNNWSITQMYEPGSTFKILTLAAALEKKKIKEDFKYLDKGKIKVNKTTIKNYNYKAGYEKELDLINILRHSSNTASAEIALSLGAENFYKELKKFDIGEKTGIELQGESAGYLKDYNQWSQIDLATTGFGQGVVAVTPIQLVTAVNAIANNGILVKPHLIKAIKNADKRKIIKKTQIKSKRVISKKTAKIMTTIMTESVKENLEDQSHLSGNIKNISVAGKTGTSQKFCKETGTYYPDQVITSFIGFFPAQKPKYLMLVVFDNPKIGRFGDTVAGPVFNEIGEFLTQN